MKVKEIKVDKIKIHQNIRSKNGDVSDLMKSIEKEGLLQPIGVYEKEGKFILAYGSRRLQAVKKLGWETIDVTILPEEFTEEGFLTTNTIENICRKDISPVELGRICKLFGDMDFSSSEIAVKLHIKTSRVKACKNLFLRLPDEFKDVIGFIPRGSKNEGKIPSHVATAILRMRINKKQIVEVLEFAKIHELTTREVFLIDRLLRTGLSLTDILKNLDKYAVRNINIAINKIEWDKMRGNYTSFEHYVKDIIRGDVTPSSKLLI